MVQNVSFGALVDPEESDLERRRRMAEALRQQSMQQEPMQTAGGMTVPYSPVQGLAKLAQALSAAKLDKDSDQRAQALRDRRATEASSEVSAMVNALRGKPAQSFQTGANEMGDDAATQSTPAQAPNPNQALEIAMRSRNPMLQQMGGSLMTSMLPKTPKWEKVERPLPDGRKEVGYVDVNSPNPWSTFQVGGTAAVKREFVNGQAVNPYTSETYGQPIPEQLKPDSVVTRDSQGNLVPNMPVVAAKGAIAAAGKPSMSSTVINAGPKAFETELGKLDAEQLGKWRAAAETANATLGTVGNLRAAEAQGAYAGAGADAKLAGARFINAITGTSPKGMVGSELYNAESKKLILDHIKSLGANPSNADREFIEKTVPQLATSSQARAAMANFMEQKARTQIDLYQRADAHARQNHGLGGFPQFQPPAQGAPAAAPGGFRIIGVQ